MKAITIEIGAHLAPRGLASYWATVLTDDKEYEEIQFDSLREGLIPFVETMFGLFGTPVSVPHRNPYKPPTLSGVFVRLSADSNNEYLAEYVKKL